MPRISCTQLWRGPRVRLSSKERRMRFREPTKPHRKSGMWDRSSLSLLYGVKPGDPISFFGVAVILLMVALLAVLIPARRAVSLDPVAALRSD
jgi:hypothetical protein